MTTQPRFSIITPVHDPTPSDLHAMLASVRAQRYERWEHCIVDDGSTLPHVGSALREAAGADSRVKVRRLDSPNGISAASNAALAMASGEFVAFLDHDDALHRDALAEVDAAISEHDDVDYVYTDEDKIDVAGRHCDPFLKPDWSPERMRAQMYTCHLSVIRRALVEEVGGLRPEFDGSQDWDLVLRISERARRIVHVPRVLYSWRTTPGSTAGDVDAKPYASDAARRAVAQHARRIGLQCDVEISPDLPGCLVLRPALQERPLVSIVIPTGGFVREISGRIVDLVVNTVQSVVKRSTYENIEIVVVADASVPDGTREQLRQFGARIVPFPRPFSFPQKINVGAIHARGDYLLLLNDDIEVLPDGWRENYPNDHGKSSWIEAMLMYALHPEVGSVGAKLYFADTRIQHVGLVNTGAGPSHVYHLWHRDAGGYFNNALLPANYLAMTGACLLTRRDAFERVGGFSRIFPINYNDVDFGFKLHRAGYRNVFTPDAELLHFESSSRDSTVHEHELQLLRDHWGALLANDPYYHPQFVPGPYFVHPPYLANGEFVA